MFVIGTAGHVDHGKSTLVQAMTGIDPDRLREEKSRGMTIDLGFAWMTLPSGRDISIVDVPGHERFIKNMLAGVGGIDLALLVVAADESVMPQTREHLAILDLLKVARGIVVITKTDLVDRDIQQLVELEIEEALLGTMLEGAPIVGVAAMNGEGLPDLLSVIDNALDQAREPVDLGRPRLSVDRAFTIAGFGTVVTGTLVDGALHLGQEIEVIPSGIRSRIRGLQSHQQKIVTALPGMRVAVNLPGISTADLVRGDVVTNPGWLAPTKAIDAQISLIEQAPHGVGHNHPISFYAGAAETSAKIRLLNAERLEPGGNGWAQLTLQRPIALVRGDRFVIRSPDITLGGGVVTEVNAKRHRRNNQSVLERLETISEGSPTAQLISALETSEPASVEEISKRANLIRRDALMLAKQAVDEGSVVALSENIEPNGYLYTTSGWTRLAKRAQLVLEAFHGHNPLRKGMTREELKSRLGVPSKLISAILGRLSRDGVVKDEFGVVRLPWHYVNLSEAAQHDISEYIESLRSDPFPSNAPVISAELLSYLVAEGQVVRTNEGIVFDFAAFESFSSQVVGYIQSNGTITVAQLRDLLGTSRKYALGLLDLLDEHKITRRVGDERVLL